MQLRKKEEECGGRMTKVDDIKKASLRWFMGRRIRNCWVGWGAKGVQELNCRLNVWLQRVKDGFAFIHHLLRKKEEECGGRMTKVDDIKKASFRWFMGRRIRNCWIGWGAKGVQELNCRLNVWLQRSEGWVRVHTSSGEAFGS
ncbi:UNVERIFIED_CONTAM: hypothetical protein Sradi_0583600 [Sesamum radiatum]|uniref:Uncharacterized protein n=1 Tax=Sesamum radiatum TaxID=300843 RepID=A0AAW2VKG0_SESRA